MSRRVLAALVVLFLGIAAIYRIVPPPAAVDRAAPWREAQDLRWFSDATWLDDEGQRNDRQSIFDAVFERIQRAETLLLIDMFLFNEWQGPVPETRRALADELVDNVLARLVQRPQLQVIMISDPINTVYGGLASEHFDRLRAGGVAVVLTDLSALQDSNPAWSVLWRTLISPFTEPYALGSLDDGLDDDSGDGWLPNPFGAGKVPLTSYLALLNFKANHRKLLIADDAQGRLTALITSANPHDGSSAHRNVALGFGGQAVNDLVYSELALLQMNQAPEAVLSVVAEVPEARAEPQAESMASGSTQIRVLTEQAIKDSVLESLQALGPGDRADLYMFYLADRAVVAALRAASGRGVRIRVLLDRNLDAFGRRKNGVPNKPVAAELVEAGITVRWCATAGEQCHAKLLLLDRTDTDGAAGLTDWCCRLLLGSANFTRRNLDNYNLETNVLLQASSPFEVWHQAKDEFEAHWNNTDGRRYSWPYAKDADERRWLAWQYRFMEATGLSTF